MVTLLECTVFRSLGAPPTSTELLIVVGTLNGVQFGWLLVNLLILRVGGFHLSAGR
jgi:hypothetical protein